MACIFCGSTKNLTDEHVFPAFMGGKLEVIDGSCNGCNGSYSSAEAALKDATIPLLNLLQVKNRDGVVPQAPLKAGIIGLDMKNVNAFMDGQGEIRLLDTVERLVVDGRNVRRGFFITKEGGDTFSERGLKRGEQLIPKEVPGKIVIDAKYTVDTSFAKTFDARRIAAKIALTAIAYQYDTSFALSEQFDELRETRTAKSVRVWIFANEGFISDHPRTAHEHNVICYLSAGMRKGWAIVTLFGGLTYRVDLTADYRERQSRQFSIFYDANLKKRVNPIVLYDEIALMGHVLSSASKFEDGGAVDAQWYPIVSAFAAQKGLIVEKLKT
jgi:hypothetical protein